MSQRKRKQVHVTFEYYDNSDLKAILDDLREKLSFGIETHYSEIKVREIEDKYQTLKFQQMYLESEYEMSEKEINGELRLVIKSKI